MRWVLERRRGRRRRRNKTAEHFREKREAENWLLLLLQQQLMMMMMMMMIHIIAVKPTSEICLCNNYKKKLKLYTKIYDQLEHHPSINHMKKQQPTPRNCNHQKEAPERISYCNCIPEAGAAAVIAPHAATSVPVAAAFCYFILASNVKKELQ
jgi:hypothetical protein